MFFHFSLQKAYSYLQNFPLQTADQALPKDNTSLGTFDLPRSKHFSFLLPQSLIITEWLLVGCNSVIYQTGINSVTQFAEVIQMEVVLSTTFFPNIFSQIVKLGTTNTTNFHLFSSVWLCFLPVQVLLVSLLPHGSICNQARKGNVPTLFRDNSNKTSISKVQPENSYPESAPFFLSFCSRDTGQRQPTQMYMSALSVLPVRQWKLLTWWWTRCEQCTEQ